MKYFKLLILLFCFYISEAGEWEVISKFPGYTRIHDMKALDSLRFVISGQTTIGKYPDFEQYSFIAITKNGGYDWDYIFKDYMVLPDKNNIDIQEVDWVKDSSIFAGLTGGFIIHTNNLGRTWDTVFTPDGIPYHKNNLLEFDNSGMLGVCRFSGIPEFLLTDDGGKTWEKIPSPEPGININSIKRFDENKILLHFFVDKQTNFWLASSEDKGKTWNIVKESDNYMIRFKFLDDNLGFIGGVLDPANGDTRSIIKRTTDGGNTWHLVWTSEEDYHQSINYFSLCKHLDSNIIFALSYGFIYKSYDYGENWELSFSYSQDSLPVAINDVIECSGGNCLFTNSDGLVLKYVGSNVSVENIIKNLYNFSTYPNPLPQGQSLNIEIEMENSGNVTIDLVNLLGVKVANIYEGYLSAGKRTFFKTFKENLPSRTFYLRMTVNGKQLIVKTVVLE